MATRTQAKRRSAPRDEVAPMGALPDDIADLFAGDDDDDDADDLESLYGAPRRSGSRRGGASRLPHGWADFDYGDGSFDNDWR